MALSDLAVYSEFVYTTFTEVLRQNVALFNSASNNTILLRSASHVGDFSDEVFWAKVDGLVRSRNPYTNGAVSEKNLAQLTDTMVKIARGTPPVRIDPGMLKWIQRSPEEAGAVLGRQLAVDTLADMVNTALGAGVAALEQIPAVYLDITGETVKTMTFGTFNTGQAKFGDASSQIAAWVMHSKPMFDIYTQALANSEQLFQYGNVQVRRDPFGRTMIVTDSPALTEINVVPDPDVAEYFTLGLTQNAIVVDQNGDFTANEETKNGNENIVKTYQAEWSYELGVKGFAWDKVNGGKAPNDAAIFSSGSWDRTATSHKDLAGVLVRTR
jgi:hypothetical protein